MGGGGGHPFILQNCVFSVKFVHTCAVMTLQPFSSGKLMSHTATKNSSLCNSFRICTNNFNLPPLFFFNSQLLIKIYSEQGQKTVTEKCLILN